MQQSDGKVHQQAIQCREYVFSEKIHWSKLVNSIHLWVVMLSIAESLAGKGLCALHFDYTQCDTLFMLTTLQLVSPLPPLPPASQALVYP